MFAQKSAHTVFHDQLDHDTTVPRAVNIIRSTPEAFELRVRRTGMFGAHVFLIVWMMIAGSFSLFLISIELSTVRGWIYGEQIAGKDLFIVLVSLVFIASVFFCCTFLLYSLFAKKVFRGDVGNFAVETSVLGYRWRRAFPKSSITKFAQVKDGGEDEDSFPSWGLKVHATQEHTVIYRQPFEVSDWLGRYFARWAGVDYVSSLQS